jgi:hypothetical protein
MAKTTANPWTRALTYPITLRDGGIIITMAQAGHLITQRLPKARQEKPVSQHTADLLMQAHKRAR